MVNTPGILVGDDVLLWVPPSLRSQVSYKRFISISLKYIAYREEQHVSVLRLRSPVESQRSRPAPQEGIVVELEGLRQRQGDIKWEGRLVFWGDQFHRPSSPVGWSLGGDAVPHEELGKSQQL